eukprot:SAG22_NODE_524_length_9488_cov_16.150602_2_plen_41_part_00
MSTDGLASRNEAGVGGEAVLDGCQPAANMRASCAKRCKLL